MVIKFDKYIEKSHLRNEGLKDFMTPKSEDDIKDLLKTGDSMLNLLRAIQWNMKDMVELIIKESIDKIDNMGKIWVKKVA